MTRVLNRVFTTQSTGRWIVAALLAAGAATAMAEVRWRNAQAASPRAEGVHETLREIAARPDRQHVIVELGAMVTDESRAAFRARGLELLEYLGGNTFFATVRANAAVDALTADGQVTRAAPIALEHKLAPAVLAGEYPAYARSMRPGTYVEDVAAYVIFHADVPLSAGLACVRKHGGQVVDEISTLNGAVIELPLAALLALADEDAVQWIEPPLPKLSGTNNSNRPRVQADVAQAAPYSLDGSGVTVMVYDGGLALSSHVDFGGRLTTHDSSGLSYHATHVAGTIGGDGTASGGLYAGMAPGVALRSYGFQYDYTGTFLYSNPGDLESDYFEAINTYGADIANNSIGTNTETNGFPCEIQGDYGVTSALIDEIVRGSFGQPFRVVWAAGNERQGSRCDIEGYGDYYSTAPPAGAKNHIAVGAVNSNNDTMTSFSAWGPTDDGRLKPDICGPGCQSSDDYGVTSCYTSSNTSYATLCGTSMAAPTVTGCLALLLEDYRAQFPSQPDPRNSTLKILLAHNAVDLGNTGPDYQYGYGSVRVQDTIDFMRSGNFAEGSISQGGAETYQVTVPTGADELKITLAWDDAPGTPNVNPALVNDLDLVVTSPGGARTYPWTLDPASPSLPAVRTQADHINNIEQVHVNNPAAGTWTVQIVGNSVPQGPQPFSVCASPELSTGGVIDCNNNGIADDQDIANCDGSVWCSDCNGNGVPDGCDVSGGTSSDCDSNGVPDECQPDGDGDGTIDACDGCPADPNKTGPGACGCGIADTDSDGDGTPDCDDGCPNDPGKVAPGTCGCGTPDVDSDGDGALDCVDGCPSDPNKTDPGQCGCGTPDVDSDGDGYLDCEDNCPSTYNPSQADCDDDGIGDACTGGPDCNGNGIPDSCDIADGTSDDCNDNGIPDACDISSGASLDDNSNGVPDECEQSEVVDVVAGGESTEGGTIGGSYVDTWSDDGVFQIVTERESGGKPSLRHSYVIHKWTFDLPASNLPTLYLDAYRTASSDGDDFVFAYSTDDADYVDMFTLLKTSDDGAYVTYALPPSLQGPLYVRVVDTDQSQGNRALDTVYVDHLFVRTEASSGGQPPAAPSSLAAMALSGTEITLSWTDNSGDESGFEIERSLDGSQWTLIDTVGANTTSYQDASLVPGTTYFYRVRAYSSGGQSAYSNTASATTPTAGGDIVLDAIGSSLGVNQVTDLTWTGGASANVDIYRNGELIATVSNSGSYRDAVGKRITGTYVYQVCESGTTTCSNEATVDF